MTPDGGVLERHPGLVIPQEGKDWYLQVAVKGEDDDRAASVQVAEIALDRPANG
ncbi:MAG: hypothetical protein IPN02_10170 [Candidatus Microthrix sp.]|uniref:Uncharacterized protein n=1 Tax=Candidatus Neomicrothrix subdominans TaxID=2954438 RepID=A0A936TEL1_9ACTN|nr:hypothetical protein [Candidatus Microthrix subdominans]